jgi:hypothetical protein
MRLEVLVKAADKSRDEARAKLAVEEATVKEMQARHPTP